MNIVQYFSRHFRLLYLFLFHFGHHFVRCFVANVKISMFYLKQTVLIYCCNCVVIIQWINVVDLVSDIDLVHLILVWWTLYTHQLITLFSNLVRLSAASFSFIELKHIHTHTHSPHTWANGSTGRINRRIKTITNHNKRIRNIYRQS